LASDTDRTVSELPAGEACGPADAGGPEQSREAPDGRRAVFGHRDVFERFRRKPPRPGNGALSEREAEDQFAGSVTIGEPTRTATEDARLGSVSWTSQPQIHADGGSLGSLTLRGGSVCGRRHAARGQSREDAFAFGTAVDGTVVIAAGDGVGDESARFSAMGSRTAVVEACRLVIVALDAAQPITSAVVCDLVSAQMRRHALHLLGYTPEDGTLSTTLIVAWVRPTGEYAGFMVGDGGVLQLDTEGFSPVAAPRGESFTETSALPGSYSTIEEFSGQLRPGSALLAATDGLYVPLGSREVAAYLARHWRQPPPPLVFVHQLSFDRRGEWDDRTGVCVWFAPDGVPKIDGA
jgi:hypothetical protein